MSDYQIILITLIICGWGVTWFVANRTNKKNDRANLINKKNDMLVDLEYKALMCWSANYDGNEKYQIYELTHQIINVYQDLKRDHKDAYPEHLANLRRTLTLDIDNKENLGEQEISERRRNITEVIKDLRQQPQKFKSWF